MGDAAESSIWLLPLENTDGPDLSLSFDISKQTPQDDTYSSRSAPPSEYSPGKGFLSKSSYREPGSRYQWAAWRWPRREYAKQEHQLWTPLCLRRRSLAVFLYFWIIIAISLAVLTFESSRNHGLGTPDAKISYLWTYAPTAVFTVVGMLWDQVEYRTKALQPWSSMNKSPKPASQTILLDYVSPWNLIVLFKACRARHLSIMLAILGGLILKLMIILSTGLFIFQLFPITQSNAHLKALDQFAFSGLDFSPGNVDFRPIEILLGEGIYKVPKPQGTSETYAFQSIESSQNDGSPIIIEAVVDAFSTTLECEEAKIQYSWSEYYNFSSYPDDNWINVVTVASPTLCKNATADWEISPDNTATFTQLRNCSGVYDTKMNPYFLAVGNITETYPPVPSLVAYVCAPVIKFKHLSVTLDPSSSPSLISTSILQDLNMSIPGVEPYDIATAFEASRLVVEGWPGLSGGGLGYGLDIFGLINQTLGNTSIDLFHDNPDLLKQSVNETWAAFGAQLAKLYFMQPAKDQNLLGTSTSSQQRLSIHGLSVWLIEGCLVSLIIITMFLTTSAPRGQVSRDPASVAGLTAILARSPGLMSVLQNTGAMDAKHLQNILAGHLYRTNDHPSGAQQRTFHIDAVPSNWYSAKPKLGNERLGWYRPLAITLPMRLLTPIFILAIVATLEGLYQRSAHNQGLFDVSEASTRNYIHYLWHYIPALLMLLVAAMVSMLAFSAKVMRPFLNLQKSGLAQTTILLSPYNTPSLAEVWMQIRHGHLEAISTTMAVVLSALLAIVVSNLYSSKISNLVVPTSVMQLDWFPPMTSNEGNNMTGSLAVNMVVNGNLSWPAWTYSELVFPQIQAVEAQAAGTLTASGKLEVRIPALRAQFNCTSISKDRTLQLTASRNLTLINPENEAVNDPFIYNYGGLTGNTSRAITYKATDPLNCEWLEDTVPQDGVGQHPNHTNIWSWQMPAPADGFFAALDSYSNVGLTYEALAAGCPRVFFWFGRTNSGRVEDFSAVTCSPYIGQLDVDVTFNMPGYGIDTAAPPKPDESTLTIFTNSSRLSTDSGSAEGDYNLLQQIGFVMDISTPDVLDGFFSNVIYGSEGVPASELSGTDNIPRLIDAAEHLFRIGAAQIINAYRDTVPCTTAKFNGTLSVTGAERLVQDAVSTRILEGLLAAIFVCVIVTYLMIDTRNVLPKNPASIAAMASLVAGSSLLTKEVFPEGAEWWDNKEMVRRGIFDGLIFSMRWWSEVGSDDSRFGIDGT